MPRNVSIQTYLPKHVAAWVQNEATHAKQSRSQWIGAIVTDLFQGQDLREENRQNIELIKRNLTFMVCAIDGLLAGHADPTLRARVHEAYRRKAGQVEPELGQ
jgi:hypothetical protein